VKEILMTENKHTIVGVVDGDKAGALTPEEYATFRRGS
jgi:hypothetical protein